MSHPNPFTIDQAKADLEFMTKHDRKLTYWLWGDDVRVDVHTDTDVYGYPSVVLVKRSPGRGIDAFSFNSLDSECGASHDEHFDAMFKWMADTINQQIERTVPKGHPLYPHTGYSSIRTDFY